MTWRLQSEQRKNNNWNQIQISKHFNLVLISNHFDCIRSLFLVCVWLRMLLLHATHIVICVLCIDDVNINCATVAVVNKENSEIDGIPAVFEIRLAAFQYNTITNIKSMLNLFDNPMTASLATCNRQTFIRNRFHYIQIHRILSNARLCYLVFVSFAIDAAAFAWQLSLIWNLIKIPFDFLLAFFFCFFCDLLIHI